MKKLLLILGLIGLASFTTSCGTGNYYYQPSPPAQGGPPKTGIQPYPITGYPGCGIGAPVHGDCGL